MLTRRAFLKTSAGGLATASLWQFGCGGGGGGTAQVAGIYGVGEAYLSFDDSGDVFEIQSAAHTVLRRRTDGSVVWQVGEFGMGPGQLNYPTALLRDRQGQLYVVDHGNSRIQVYGADGAYLHQIGGRTADDVDDPMELDFCRAVAVDRDQRLYVCDTRDYQIQVFERDGTPAGAFGSFGDMGQDPESLNNPIALAIDPDGDVHVVDQGNYRVQVFDRSGAYVRSYGGYGDGPGQFLLPRSIAIDDNGRSYIADAAAFRISVFESDGDPFDEIEVRFDDLRLGSPLQLTWAPDDQLYVTAVPTSMT
jgi:DNA-binding beta-propeller fold protein YncE